MEILKNPKLSEKVLDYNAKGLSKKYEMKKKRKQESAPELKQDEV